MSKYSPAAILYDSASHALEVVQDGANYLLDVAAKIAVDGSSNLQRLKVDNSGSLKGGLYDTAGNALNIVTDGANKLLGAASKISENPSAALQYLKVTASGMLRNALHDASGNALSIKQDGADYHLEGAPKIAQDISNNLQRLEVDDSGTVKSGLYDTAGTALNVVTDGANKLLGSAAKVIENPSDALGYLQSDASGTLKSGLYDASGNALNITTDDARKILATEAKIAEKSDTSLHRLIMNNSGTVKVTLYSEEGSQIAMPITAPDPTLLTCGFVEQATGTDKADLRVDGSVTPVSFTFNADPTYNLDLIGFTFVIVANALTFGADKFAGLSSLTNGIDVKVTAGGSTGTLYNLFQNECFLHAASIGGFSLLIANKDVIYSSIVFGGSIRLVKNTADKIEVVINDNLSSGIDYFKCSVKAIKEA